MDLRREIWLPVTMQLQEEMALLAHEFILWINLGCLPRTKKQQKGISGYEPTCQCRRHKRCRFDPWVQKIPQGYGGDRSLVGYSP